MKYLIIIFFPLAYILGACNSDAKKQEQKKQDSVEMEKVDQMLLDQDSLIKAKEKELLEKYK